VLIYLCYNNADIVCVLEQEYITSRAFTQDTDSEYPAAIAELSVGRLMKDKKPELNITNTEKWFIRQHVVRQQRVVIVHVSVFIIYCILKIFFFYV